METLYIAGWRDGIRNPEQSRHWRLYRGLSRDLIPVTDIRFVWQGLALPLHAASSKQANAQGFHVWFDCIGDFIVHGDLCRIDLGVDHGHAFSFSVRPASLYTADDWRNWRVYDAHMGLNVRQLVFFYRGRPLPISSQARKISDPRELMAWLEAVGDLVAPGDQATIELWD